MRARLLLLLTVLASPAAAFEAGPWTSPHVADHPLVGRIVTGAGVDVAPEVLAAATKAARFLVLGETHTNPDHHRLQAAILRARTDRPAVVFEMIPQGLQGALDAYLAGGGDAAGFGAAVQWTERGWPDFSIYRPIVDAALAEGSTIRAGDLDRDTIRRVSREGAGALGAERQARFGLDRPLPEAARADLADTLEASHCGMLPASAIAPMITVQRARDGALAAAMVDAAGAMGSAVLVAGSGHARTDRAVPALIRAMVPGAAVVSVAFVEVETGEDAPAAYGIGVYDFVVFTPRFDVSDPCEGMKAPMRN